jgi:deoxyadenosine/deoxycytidine kinase
MIIGIMGESGSGKTTSMRNLDPKTTYYIDCDKKGLSWKGWKEQYNKEKNHNYFVCDDAKKVEALLRNINEKGKDAKVVVIDTLNGLMVADEMRRSREKGYDKWVDLAASVYSLIDYALTCRPDLTVIFVAHSQTDRDDTGFAFTRIKTSGRKLDKIVLESKFPVVLYCKGNGNEHVFEVHANNSTAKTPMGAFEQDTIPNDIIPVLETLKDY